MKKFFCRTALLFLMIYSVAINASAATLLVPGGQVIGLALQDNTVTVAAFDEKLGAAARNAGLKEGDRILRIDDTKICNADDVRKALTCSDGQVDIAVMRGNKTKELTLCPALTKDGPRLGVYLKQGTTGIGTVTYYDPETENFAALGHSVNAANGDILQMQSGTVYPAQVQSVKKGASSTAMNRPGPSTKTPRKACSAIWKIPFQVIRCRWQPLPTCTPVPPPFAQP